MGDPDSQARPEVSVQRDLKDSREGWVKLESVGTRVSTHPEGPKEQPDTMAKKVIRDPAGTKDLTDCLGEMEDLDSRARVVHLDSRETTATKGCQGKTVEQPKRTPARREKQVKPAPQGCLAGAAKRVRTAEMGSQVAQGCLAIKDRTELQVATD